MHHHLIVCNFVFIQCIDHHKVKAINAQACSSIHFTEYSLIYSLYVKLSSLSSSLMKQGCQFSKLQGSPNWAILTVMQQSNIKDLELSYPCLDSSEIQLKQQPSHAQLIQQVLQSTHCLCSSLPIYRISSSHTSTAYW